MLSDSVVTLKKPNLDLSESVREALVESYENLKEFELWPEPNPSIENVRSHMELAISNFENHVNEYRFFIVRNCDLKLVGTIGLIIRNPKIPYLEFGYWIRSSESRKGYISASVKLLEEYAIDVLKVRRLEIRMAESNLASKRVAERAGYKFEAKIHFDRMLPDGRIANSLVYSKLYPHQATVA